jgi:hypothetical protein
VSRGLLAVSVSALVLIPSLAAATPPQLRAKLTAVAPAHSSGTFTATGVVNGGTVTMRWQLRLTNLSGTPTKATMSLKGLRGVSFVLCRPCNASASGRVGLVRSAWNNLLANGAQLVIATRAQPGGELRGTVKRG